MNVDGDPGGAVLNRPPAWHRPTEEPDVVPSSVSIVETPGKGLGIVAARHIEKGEALFAFSGRLVSSRKVSDFNAALQVERDLFLESEGSFDELINHSCSPNCYIDFSGWTLVAAREIGGGEELTFDYNTSEYDLVAQSCAFTCSCRCGGCVGEVKGFRYLPLRRKIGSMSYLSPYLKERLRQELKTGFRSLPSFHPSRP